MRSSLTRVSAGLPRSLCSHHPLSTPFLQASWNQLLITLLSNATASTSLPQLALKAHPSSSHCKAQPTGSENHHDLKLGLINWNQRKEEKTFMSVSCICCNHFLWHKYVTFFFHDRQQSRSQDYPWASDEEGHPGNLAIIPTPLWQLGWRQITSPPGKSLILLHGLQCIRTGFGSNKSPSLWQWYQQRQELLILELFIFLLPLF